MTRRQAQAKHRIPARPSENPVPPPQSRASILEYRGLITQFHAAKQQVGTIAALSPAKCRSESRLILL